MAKGHAFLVNGSLQRWSAQAGPAELRAIVNFKTSLKSLELSEPIIFYICFKIQKAKENLLGIEPAILRIPAWCLTTEPSYT